jgi:zinc transporter ZupT
MVVAVGVILIIAVLIHLLWLGFADLFVRGGQEKRAQALWYAFMFGFMACCCRAVWALTDVLSHYAFNAGSGKWLPLH